MELSIAVADDHLSKLIGLLTPSFSVRAQVVNDLKAFVCEQLGVHDAYFEERIQTIFLDSKPVDDVTKTAVRDGSVLALSAAMPGLVGAIFRKGGQYSWMRKSISYEGENNPAQGDYGWVTVKLFNMVLKELGPGFLEQGVWVDGERVQAFVKVQPIEFRQHIQALPLDGMPISPEAFLDQDLSGSSIFLKVRSFAE